ncbi:uncharacterized protein A4U43_C07F8130, partial [Asparagus officinalis]
GGRSGRRCGVAAAGVAEEGDAAAGGGPGLLTTTQRSKTWNSGDGDGKGSGGERGDVPREDLTVAGAGLEGVGRVSGVGLTVGRPDFGLGEAGVGMEEELLGEAISSEDSRVRV